MLAKSPPQNAIANSIMQASEQTLPVEAFDKEALVRRSPHPDFGVVENKRPHYDHGDSWTMTKTPSPGWKIGQGATRMHWEDKKSVSIDPTEQGRDVNLNYKLMISTTVPRPVALVSTLTADGKTKNLAPFSYFQCVVADPPLYSLAFAGEEANDSLRNILDTGELCISLTSDWFIEAANFTSVNTPAHVSEWTLSGLTETESDTVRPGHVRESPFSAECRLFSHQEIKSRVTGKRTATLCLVEIVRFHVWEDALAEDKATVDPSKLRPVFRAGGITYGTCLRGFEILRPPPFRHLAGRQDVKSLLGIE